MVHGPMAAEFRALVVLEVDAIGVVKPWQKAAAVAATQRDSDSFMVAIRGRKIMLCVVLMMMCVWETTDEDRSTVLFYCSCIVVLRLTRVMLFFFLVETGRERNI